MYTTLNDSIDLSSQVAIVTGGGTGVGYGITRVFLQCGASVAIAGRSDVHNKVAEELGPSAFCNNADITIESGCNRVVQETAADFGGLHIPVNNSAAPPRRINMAIEEDIVDWQKSLDVTLRGAYQMSRAAGSTMIEQQRGSIISISSIGGLRSMKVDMAYTTGKAALQMMTQNLASQWAELGVRVNSIAVGYVNSGFSQTINLDGEFVQQLKKDTPLGRASSPEEIGWPVAFLALAQASFINGVILPDDGGQLAH